MTSTMYVPLVNVSDAANNGEHSTFGRFMAKRTCFVMVKMCMPVCDNGAKFARSSREIWPKFAFARVAVDTGEGHNTNRALKGHYGHPVCGKGVVLSRRDPYFIFFRIFETISSVPTH